MALAIASIAIKAAVTSGIKSAANDPEAALRPAAQGLAQGLRVFESLSVPGAPTSPSAWISTVINDKS